MNTPRLRYKKEFEDILEHYVVSDDAKVVLKDLPMVLIMGATGTGRSLLVQHMKDSGRYFYIVSDTTRPPQTRDGQLEQNGLQYFFRSEEEILADLKAGNFLEAELIHQQQVSGISMRELKKAAQSGKVAFTETDLAGVLNIKKAKADVIVIFLLPPSYGEWQKRIADRGGVSQAEANRRLKTAARFLREAPQYDFFQFVVAEDVGQSMAIIDGLTKGQSNPQQERGAELVKTLLKELEKAIT